MIIFRCSGKSGCAKQERDVPFLFSTLPYVFKASQLGEKAQGNSADVDGLLKVSIVPTVPLWGMCQGLAQPTGRRRLGVGGLRTTSMKMQEFNPIS